MFWEFPTIGGEVEFDECYTNYAMVDVAAIGFGKKENLIKNHAKKRRFSGVYWVVLLEGMVLEVHSLRLTL